MRSNVTQSALRAILFADAEGYSRHMHSHEQATLDFMQRCFATFRDLAPMHDGEMLKTTGDGALVEFTSATEAVLYALAAQEQLRSLADGQPKNHQIRFRIGIHLGEVKHRDGDVYGHIVNVASRLEHLAEPGGICISQTVFEQVRQAVPAAYGSLGPRSLKNIPQPIVAYRVHRSNVLSAEGQGIAPGEISICLIERLSLSDAEGTDLALKSVRARALVGYLILGNQHKEVRERVIGLLWSNQDIHLAQQEYRSVVRQIQTTFQRAGSDAFHSNANDVRMTLSALRVDLLTISDSLDEGLVAPELFEGRVSPEQIMADLDRTDQVFDAWLRVTRHRWRNRLIEQLETCLDRTLGDSLTRKHAAIALLSIDSTHEPAARMLMKVHGEEGKTAAAIRVYESLREVLARDFGIEPSAETQKTIQQIRSGQPVPLDEAGSEVIQASMAFEGRLPVIVVRPFVAADEKDGKDHLLEGFRAEVIFCLIKFRDWVIVEEHDGQRLPDASSNVKIDYRLETRMQSSTSGETVRFTLVDCSNDRVVWSERFPLELQEWGTAPSGIARKTAAVLDIYLSAERVGGRTGTRDGSLASYDNWLRGENLLTLWQPEAEIEAERLFKSVIEQMPRFAPAYSSLASIYNVRHIIVAGFHRDPALEAEALKLAQKAVQIDPLETRAHLTLAWSYLMAERFEQADIHYELAFDLNPNNPKTLLSCAHGFAFTGQTERASELARLALGLTPFVTPFQWEYLTGIRFIVGDYPGAVEAANLGAGSMHDTHVWKAAALALMGNAEESRRAAEGFLAGARAQWAGNRPDDRAIVDWMLSGIPIKEKEVRKRLVDGLRLAGLPTG
ncbi:adenylate/guanylate cyclase domain-containing protein [Mesorhizobium sp. IMUNJ 23232]|uniref:adenylate/guanylate cyclase domain-containing protein n=1 Tax=Mesorhizobium sp. IMUNJ 23232 TaxID=3376064 RepID=UPI0037AAEA1B